MLQLTSLQSLQKSLDILRTHRPAYTPRTGFVWPIVEPSSGNSSAAKKRTQDGEPAPDTQETEEVAGTRGLATASSDTKRQQNNMLLFNAMSTTAVHAHQSFQLPVLASEENVPETPAAATVGRSSVTPAPGPGGVATRAPSIAPTPQEAPKGPPGGGKKKKKRKSDSETDPVGDVAEPVKEKKSKKDKKVKTNGVDASSQDAGDAGAAREKKKKDKKAKSS